MRTSEKLRQIPGAENYFVLIEQQCNPAPRSIQSDRDILSCGFVENIQLPSVVQLVMPFGGKSLMETPKRIQNLNFQQVGQRLLEAGALMLVGGVIHRDLHSQNVLIQNPTTPKIIDFGESWLVGDITEANVTGLMHM